MKRPTKPPIKGKRTETKRAKNVFKCRVLMPIRKTITVQVRKPKHNFDIHFVSLAAICQDEGQQKSF